MNNKCFKALADPIRRNILNYIKSGELSVGELTKKFSLTEATISYHLAVLKRADLIYERRQGKYIYYGLNTSVFEEFILWIKQLKEK